MMKVCYIISLINKLILRKNKENESVGLLNKIDGDQNYLNDDHVEINLEEYELYFDS